MFAYHTELINFKASEMIDMNLGPETGIKKLCTPVFCAKLRFSTFLSLIKKMTRNLSTPLNGKFLRENWVGCYIRSFWIIESIDSNSSLKMIF